jgi:probable rRNA maturation factor
VELFAHHVPPGFDLARLERFTSEVVAGCLGCPGPEASALDGLSAIEVNLVDDETIAGLHGEFLGDPSPTDVITFPHGEVFLSLETAQRAAARAGNTPEREAALYLAHAVLHLHGHRDGEAAGRAVMERCQEEVLAKLWPR